MSRHLSPTAQGLFDRSANGTHVGSGESRFRCCGSCGNERSAAALLDGPAVQRVTQTGSFQPGAVQLVELQIPRQLENQGRFTLRGWQTVLDTEAPGRG